MYDGNYVNYSVLSMYEMIEMILVTWFCAYLYKMFDLGIGIFIFLVVALLVITLFLNFIEFRDDGNKICSAICEIRIALDFIHFMVLSLSFITKLPIIVFWFLWGLWMVLLFMHICARIYSGLKCKRDSGNL